MERITSSFTVFFEDPFWVGVYERVSGSSLKAGKVTFGAEPTDQEVYQWVLRNSHLLTLSPAVTFQERPSCRANPKRLQRDASRLMTSHGVGTKAQQALKLQQEQKKQEHQTRSRENRQLEKERRRQLHLQKKKEKHRGR